MIDRSTGVQAPAGEQTASNQDSGGATGDNRSEGRIDESQLTFKYGDSQAETAPGESVAPEIQVFGIWDLLRMVLVLALVVAVIYGLYWLLRRSKTAREEDGNFINVLSSQTLSGGKYLHVIDVAGKVYLLGSGDSGVNLISEIQDKPSIDELRLHASRSQLQNRNFSQLLGSVFSNGFGGKGESANKSGEAEPANGAIGFDFVRRQRQRLKKL